MRGLCKQWSKAGKPFLLTLALLVGACTPIIDNRGHSQQSLDTSQLTPGVSRHEDVSSLLGSPSLKSDYGDIWYYVSMQKETVGLMAPEIVQQEVVEVTFNTDGTLKDISKYSQKDGKPVQIVEKSTPSAGHSLTFIEQLLGNFGKFATPGRQIDPTRGY